MKIRLMAAAALIAPFFTPLAHAGEDALSGEARKVATTLPPKLLAVLQDEISKSGPEGAIPVCKDMAPKMAGEISQQTGWKIKRVSLKARNDVRAIPDEWEKAALEDFDKRAAAGELPAQLEKGERIGNEYRFVKRSRCNRSALIATVPLISSAPPSSLFSDSSIPMIVLPGTL